MAQHEVKIMSYVDEIPFSVAAGFLFESFDPCTHVDLTHFPAQLHL